MNESTRDALALFAVAFLVRSVAAVGTTVTNLNPDSRYDARGFANSAERIAEAVRYGELDPLTLSGTYDLWGAFLAPYWLLPGPSGFYGRLGNALLGAFAIYNVYVVARYYHSRQAGVVATVPMIFYPSIVAVHSTLLREAIVLFGITTVVRLVVVPTPERGRIAAVVFGGLSLLVAYIHRPDNAVVYAAALGVGLLVYAFDREYLPRWTVGTGVVLSPIAFVVALPYIRTAVGFLARTRELRAFGRAVYLPQVVPQTLFELVAFSWIGAAYFLYAPFPWMTSTIPDLLIGIEGIITIAFTVAAVWGVRLFFRKNRPATVALVAGFAVAVVLYGVGTANYGTGMRHRQMFTWVIFLFGGIGLSEYVEFRGLGSLLPTDRD